MKSQLLRAPSTSVACCLIVVLVALFHFPVLLVAQSTPPDWNVGDVFVGVSGGSYQVWHSGNPTSGSPTYKLVNTISDTLGGATNGCGFDLAYRFFGTNSNSTNNLVDRYAIDNEHPIAQQFPAANNPGSGAMFVQSVAFDGGPNVYVAYSGAQNGFGTIERWTKDTNPAHVASTFGLYTLTGTFSVPVDNTHGPGWIDLGDTILSGITSISRDSTTGTVTVNSGGTIPALQTGKLVVINGVTDPGFNGQFVVTSVTQFANSTQFKYLQSGSTSVSSGGTVAAETIFYTSQGPNIRTVDTSSPDPAHPLTGTFASLSNGTILFALRILPSGNVLVAAQGNVLQVNSASVVVNKYQFGNDNNLQALSLDSSVPTRAWVGDASSNDFILFDYTTKTKIATFNTSAGSAGPLGGICVDGSFSAAEVAQQGPSQTIHQSVSAGSNTVTFPNLTGGTFNETFTGISKNQTIQVTVRDSIVDPSVALSDPVISSFNPGNPTQGSSLPGNMICDTGVTLTTFPGKCELFEVEASPNSSYSSASTQIEPATSSNLANTRLLRNLDEDITDNVDCCSGTRTTKCVYTVNEQVISGGFGDPTFQICSFTPTDGTTFSKSAGTSTITFKLGVAPTGQCGSNNNTPPGLQPLLMIVQLQTNGTAPVSIPVFIAGKSGGPPVMTLSGNTYQLQIKTTDIPAGFTYVASVVDLTANITSTAVHFTMAP